MRELTHYELVVLIKNEIEKLWDHYGREESVSIPGIEARCVRIVEYCKEYTNLPEQDIYMKYAIFHVNILQIGRAHV